LFVVTENMLASFQSGEVLADLEQAYRQLPLTRS